MNFKIGDLRDSKEIIEGTGWNEDITLNLQQIYYQGNGKEEIVYKVLETDYKTFLSLLYLDNKLLNIKVEIWTQWL